MEGLHEAYLEEMRALLGGGFENYLESLDEKPVRALRVNTLKTTGTELAALCPFPMRSAPFTGDSYLLDEAYPYGSCAAHHAGLFYMQEPSAMCAAALLAGRPLARVLDLCAAPGGKSTQLAAYMAGSGILVSNEIDYRRSKILAGNLERMGAKNALVTSVSPPRLAEALPSWFDAVLVDAPCSGEGMFRKEPQAVRDWSPAASEACAVRQREILRSAFACLSPGGLLVYSTCTFSVRENEEVIRKVTAELPLEVLPPPPPLYALCGSDLLDVPALRVFPHLHPGEGHFAALMKKTDGDARPPQTREFPAPPPRARSAFTAIWDALCRTPPWGEIAALGSRLALVPRGMPYLPNFSVLSAGVTVAEELNGGRLAPYHSLTAALKRGEAANSVNFPINSREVAAYLRGETIPCSPGFSGWGVLTAEGYPLGLVKAADGQLKNHYPKGLRNR